MTTTPINLFEYEAAAQNRMHPHEFDYVQGAATDEITMRRTRSAYEHIALRPRVLTGTHAADLATTVFGKTISAPFMLAPAGGHTRAHPEGELASARAAAKFGTVLSISANSGRKLEDVADAAEGPKWFQAYFYRNREQTVEIVRRAEDAGFDAIIVTLDSSWPSKRERNIRNGYQQGKRPNYTPEQMKAAQEAAPKGRFDSGQSSRGQTDPGATWEEVAWLRTVTKLPLIFKGIMTGEDGKLCADNGLDGLIVSNHGARNLDTTMTTIETLPEVVDAVNGKLPVFLDGGIRRGTDVAKAIALGAHAVLFGRPIFYGLALDGEDGVSSVLDILRDELEQTMILAGRPNIASIDSTLIRKMPVLD